MLTEDEKQACRAAPFLKGVGHGYGTPTEGLCPIGTVAVLRGAVPRLYKGRDEYTFLEEGKEGVLQPTANTAIALEAQKDVLAWTGHTSMILFLRALDEHGRSLFVGLL
jgi:hypothetical protein